MLTHPEDGGDEHFVDANEDAGPSSNKRESSKAAGSKIYDGRKREPQYANADASCLWELVHCPYASQSLANPD